MVSFYFQRLVEIFPFFLKGLWMTVVVAGLGLTIVDRPGEIRTGQLVTEAQPQGVVTGIGY